jgi:hypothetical protein
MKKALRLSIVAWMLGVALAVACGGGGDDVDSELFDPDDNMSGAPSTGGAPSASGGTGAILPPVDAGTPPPGDAGTPPPGDAGTPPPGDAGTPPPGDVGTPDDAGAPDADTPTLTAHAQILAISCDDRSVHYEVLNAEVDGEPVSNPGCKWTFADGSTASGCVGTHVVSFSGVQNATVVVTDPDSGAQSTITSGSTNVRDSAMLVLTAEAPECGLSFSYETTLTGGGGHLEWGVSITPFENVITPRPWPRSGTIDVSAPGTYEITVELEEERQVPICLTRVSTQVTVTQCSTSP